MDARARPAKARIPLEEPFTAELAALRDNLEYWLVESARRNRNAGVERVALFELARVFLPGDGELPEERWHVAGITDGGYFRAKGAVETLHRALHVEPDFSQLDVRGLDEGWGYFEVDLDSLFERVPDVVLYEDVITYPDVKQDLAFVVDEGVSAGDLIAEAQRAAGPGAARIPAVRRLPRRAGRARQEVDRLLGELPVTGADPHR